MEMDFYVNEGDLKETKRVIRSLDSLRFRGNPIDIGKGRYLVSILGEVLDMNQLNKYLSGIQAK